MEVIMTREDVLKLFPEATDEQITNLLNQNNSEVAREKNKASQYKADADKAKKLQDELDRINEQNLSDVEKANKDLEKANQRIADLEKAQSIANQKAMVAEKFKVTAEQANQIVKDDGTLDYDVLGQIISDKESASATAKEQELANKAGNPGGGSSGADNDTKSNAEKIASKLFGGQKQENNILSHYVNGGN